MHQVHQRVVVRRTSPQLVSSGTLKTAVFPVGALLELWSSVFAAGFSRVTVRQNSFVSVTSARRVKLSSKSWTTARYQLQTLTHFHGYYNLQPDPTFSCFKFISFSTKFGCWSFVGEKIQFSLLCWGLYSPEVVICGPCRGGNILRNYQSHQYVFCPSGVKVRFKKKKKKVMNLFNLTQFN